MKKKKKIVMPLPVRYKKSTYNNTAVKITRYFPILINIKQIWNIK